MRLIFMISLIGARPGDLQDWGDTPHPGPLPQGERGLDSGLRRNDGVIGAGMTVLGAGMTVSGVGIGGISGVAGMAEQVLQSSGLGCRVGEVVVQGRPGIGDECADSDD